MAKMYHVTCPNPYLGSYVYITVAEDPEAAAAAVVNYELGIQPGKTLLIRELPDVNFIRELPDSGYGALGSYVHKIKPTVINAPPRSKTEANTVLNQLADGLQCELCSSTALDATGSTAEFPLCNTWTCTDCGHVQPEMGSLALATR